MIFVNVIKPTHICNLACKYCYNDDVRDPIMKDETLHRTISETFEYARKMSTVSQVDFIWHGGEPMVPGMKFYRKAMEIQRAVANGFSYTNALQTNGTLLNDEWFEFLKQERFSLSISIDGPKHLHDKFRVGYDGKGSFDRVFRAIMNARSAGIAMGVCFVVSRATIEHAEEAMQFFVENKLPFNIIPLTKSGEAAKNYIDVGLEAEEYAEAWIKMYDIWQDLPKSKYVYCQDFVLKTRAILYGRGADCIGLANCSHYMISTDPDGDVSACATMSGNADMSYGSLKKLSMEEIMASEVARDFRNRAVDPHCATCKWQHVCHGGCVSRAQKFFKNIHQRDYYCPSLFKIYEHIERSLVARGIAAGAPHPLHMSDGVDTGQYASEVTIPLDKLMGQRRLLSAGVES